MLLKPALLNTPSRVALTNNSLYGHRRSGRDPFADRKVPPVSLTRLADITVFRSQNPCERVLHSHRIFVRPHACEVIDFTLCEERILRTFSIQRQCIMMRI
jgi:hypothetical protein